MCGHDTTEIVLPYKLGRFVQSGLLNTILEVKISNVLDLPSVFLRMEMFKYKSLFIFRITPFTVNLIKLNCVNHLTTVYLDEKKTTKNLNLNYPPLHSKTQWNGNPDLVIKFEIIRFF